MSSFHSIVSRRDFMKALGLAGAGVGTTAAVARCFVIWMK
ncbi:Tetrachloroethene reductive dehalogenase TceA [Dehalococcoides mccartyi]|uniref:Tetrachloroethene reductive dehalogenase TceA n=1 Tax=Dehalococcoides mccartyi TaxID=61435 RepID=A0A328EJW9_9CHLR|nr:Tetrachloroethene reductive dehalogenase TceA [Dehalococcoides mccartyi]